MPRNEPFDNGYLQQVYEVDKFTNTASLSVPIEFTLKRYATKANANTEGDLYALEMWKGTTTNLGKLDPSATWKPAIPEETLVFDYRFEDKFGGDFPLSYVVTNEWR